MAFWNFFLEKFLYLAKGQKPQPPPYHFPEKVPFLNEPYAYVEVHVRYAYKADQNDGRFFFLKKTVLMTREKAPLGLI